MTWMRKMSASRGRQSGRNARKMRFSPFWLKSNIPESILMVGDSAGQVSIWACPNEEQMKCWCSAVEVEVMFRLAFKMETVDHGACIHFDLPRSQTAVIFDGLQDVSNFHRYDLEDFKSHEDDMNRKQHAQHFNADNRGYHPTSPTRWRNHPPLPLSRNQPT